MCALFWSFFAFFLPCKKEGRKILCRPTLLFFFGNLKKYFAAATKQHIFTLFLSLSLSISLFFLPQKVYINYTRFADWKLTRQNPTKGVGFSANNSPPNCRMPSKWHNVFSIWTLMRLKKYIVFFFRSSLIFNFG